MSTPIGPDIAGHVLVEHLGEGGYSDVFLYERRSPRMKVAVKVLKDARLTDAERRQFEAEAETMAELADHPYIVQVFSADVTDDGRPYLVMKFYPGANLAERAAGSRLSVAEVLRTGVKIAGAVETAHRAGIVHRDIKPANILVSPYGEPGLTDFGIAGRAADTEDDDELGVSIPWSPPEVLDGGSNGSVQSDVYSLAATVWHLLVGRSPFEIPRGDNSPRALTQRVLRNPPPPTGRAEAPPSLDRLLQQALAKSPSTRPRTALEFAQALQSIEQEQRFAKTDIVVPGLDVAADAAHRSDDDHPDRTRLKAPQRVDGQAPRPEGSRFAPTDDRRSAAPAGSRPPAPIDRAPIDRAPVGKPPAGAAQTTRRPAASVPSSSPADGPRVRRSAPGVEPDSTVLRPLRATTADGDESVGKRPGIRPKYAIVVAAAVVLIAVVVGIVLMSGGTDHPQAQDTPSFGASNQDIGNTDLKAPVVSARYDRAAKVVHFTWTDPDRGDVVYHYLVNDDPPAKVAERAAVDIRTTDPAHTCVRVLVVLRGTNSSSGLSNKACGA